MKKNLYIKRIATVFILVVCALASADARWIPFIQNYGRSDYGSGTWTRRIAVYDKWTFFTNQGGLLVYDGVSWSKYQLNNRSEVRGVAVFPAMHRVYVGGENEYGYLEVNNETGALDYHCLSETVDPKYGRIGNVWEIYESNGALYLRGDNYILVIAGDKMNLIKAKYKIFASVMVNGAIYVGTDHGVMMIVGNQLLPISNGDLLEGKRINGMFPYGVCMMVATASDGLFYYDGKSVTPFHTNADDRLRKGVISCATIKNEDMAIGTVQSGLFIIDTQSGEVQHFDEMKGLQNNTVLSVAFDQNGSVWVGMDYGIDQIYLEDPFTYLYRSPNSYGIGHAAAIFEDKLYLGTDRGLYYTSFPVKFNDGMAEIHEVACPSAPAWYLYKNGDELFCLHDKGIFSIHGGTATRVTDILGAWSCAAVKGRPDMMFVGVYDGIFLLKKEGGQWVSKGRVSGFNDPCRYFVQSGNRQLKVYDRNVGKAVVLNLDKSLLRVVSQKVVNEEYKDHDADGLNALFADWDVSGTILRLDKNRQIIPYNKGFVLLDRSKVLDTKKLFIRRVSVTFPTDSLIYSANFCNVKPEPRIAYKNNSIRIDYQVPALHLATAVKYQFRINKGEWSAWSGVTSKEYSDLSEGKYTFEVRALMFNGQMTTDSFTFRILPPWYRTWYAYLLYLVLLAGVLRLLLVLEKRRVARKQASAVEEKAKEIDKMKVEISQLEKDKLELDVKHKSQEIANLVINVTRKNEILTELKDDIRRVSSRMGIDNPKECRRQLLLINNKIDANMEGDEVLQKFEEQFDILNDNFMRKLDEVHPELNNNERMMCAYLKMNLSSKEIAPLLNVSVRGVETIRYRLRKKLNLDRDESLSDHLNNI